MLNLKVRFKNPVFVAQLLLAIFTPILAYFGLTAQDLTTWGGLGNLIIDALSNPYVVGLIGVSVWNAVNDPLVKGFGDSQRGLTYREPQ